MPEKFPTTLVVGLVVAVAIGAGAYLWLGTGDDAPADSLQTSGSGNLPDDSMTGSSENIDTSMILVQLNELQGFEINTDTFNSEAFLSLEDYSVTISDQPVGRENPFIPSNLQQGSSVSPNTNAVNQQTIDIFDIGDDDGDDEDNGEEDETNEEDSVSDATSSVSEEDTEGSTTTEEN